MMVHQGCGALTWYVISTWPKAERRVANRLARMGCGCFFPQETGWRKFRGKMYEIARPAFPRYVFAGFAESPYWLDVYGLPGVEAALGVCGEPKSIPAQIVSDLQAAQIAGYFNPPAEERAHFEVGAEVKVMHGPFEGVRGRYAGLSGVDRAEVLMQMLNSERLVKIPVDQLALVA